MAGWFLKNHGELAGFKGTMVCWLVFTEPGRAGRLLLDQDVNSCEVMCADTSRRCHTAGSCDRIRRGCLDTRHPWRCYTARRIVGMRQATTTRTNPQYGLNDSMPQSTQRWRGTHLWHAHLERFARAPRGVNIALRALRQSGARCAAT